MNNKWIKDRIFYQIYPSSFKDSNQDGRGDLVGIIQKIPYLLDLGINALWINPIFTSPMMDGGYDIVDYFQIDPRFGTMQDFNNLIKVAKKKQLRVILDLVCGHTSEQHPNFIKSSQANRNFESDSYIWSNHWFESPNDYKFISGRYERNGNYLVNFFSTQPALNYGFQQIDHPQWQISYLDPRAEKNYHRLIKIIQFWLNKGIDGFRVDMADSLVKNDPQKQATCWLWRKIFSELRPKYPEAVFISEWSHCQALNEAGFDVDFMLDHSWNPYSRLLRLEKHGQPSVFNPQGGDLGKFIDEYLNWYQQIKGHGLIGNISGNHDFERLCPQYSQEQCKIIIAFLLCLPGVPFIYYGDEIGLKYLKNLKSFEGAYTRTGSRTPMKWNNQKFYGFSETKPLIPLEKGTNCVDQQIKDPNSLLNTIKRMIEFRKSSKDLIGEEIEFLTRDYPITMKRNNLIIIVNPLKSDLKINIDLTNLKLVTLIGKVTKTLIATNSLAIYQAI
ncbi:MAG: hypothetical protein LBV55_01605 [Acholeplasmatales bacterium]|jgi:maltose alpha-D-glucosyltransferase/alpha-amylase|nr:hypothetical protein [Acholeplasmatales bacterium]